MDAELEYMKKLLNSKPSKEEKDNGKRSEQKPGHDYNFGRSLSELSFMLRLISPLLWPRENPRLKLLVILSGMTLIGNGMVNFYVPLYAQKIVDSMTQSVDTGESSPNKTEFRWDLILIFIALKVLQGIGPLSLITLTQQMLWLPIEHHARHQIQVKFFRHLHSLSLNWMMNVRTGDILGALERGTDSIASTIEHLIYSIAPTLVDIFIAMSYLAWKFGWIYGLIVGFQIVFYLIFTAYGIEKRSQYQNSINRGEDDLNQKVLESLMNFETVKCFGNEDFEKKKYSESLKTLHKRQFLICFVTQVIQIVQLFIIYGGLLACSLLLVWTIVHDLRFTPGDYVLCTTFLMQLYSPLNYLGRYYKELRVNLIKAKSMLTYLVEEPEIQNDINSHDLSTKDGSIEFCNVSYIAGENGNKVVDNVSFKVEPATTLALVGPSGAGKSTIIRLLFRLLDASSGQVLVDQENVKNVTMESLRGAMSIVPQDTTLFNDTIGNNIKYGKLSATDYEVALAATAAQLHDRIMTFPDGYNTIVGERGTRLSGGERQRVTIARAILKDPKILILDEALSALDAKTEGEIQESLKNLCKNRTCVMITHKLANAADADKILVLKEGKVVETGRHSDLLARNGLYASMWIQQNKSSDEAKEREKDIDYEYNTNGLNNRVL